MRKVGSSNDARSVDLTADGRSILTRMETIRTFIAIQMPADIRRKLAGIGEELKKSGADAKWVHEENFHITLKFLGNVTAERVTAVSEVVRFIAEQTEAFDLVLSGVGAFPRLSRPSVVWVGISDGSDRIASLAEKIDFELGRLGFECENRPFSGHVTVARVRTPKNLERLKGMIENLQGQHVGAFGVESVAIMKSELRRTGPIYTAINEYGLRIVE